MDYKKLNELANTLKSKGLAVSDFEAYEKAKDILGIKIQNVYEFENRQELKNPDIANSDHEAIEDYDITKEDKSLIELMREAGLKSEEISKTEKENLSEKKNKEVNFE